MKKIIIFAFIFSYIILTFSVLALPYNSNFLFGFNRLFSWFRNIAKGFESYTGYSVYGGWTLLASSTHVDAAHYLCGNITLSQSSDVEIKAEFTYVNDYYARYFMVSLDCPEILNTWTYTSSGCSSTECTSGKYCIMGVGSDSGTYYYTFSNLPAGTHTICIWPTCPDSYGGEDRRWEAKLYYKINATAAVEETTTSSYVCLGGNQRVGDTNNDGQITQEDADIISNILVGNIPYPSEICCADVNEDGEITVTDAMLISQYATGERTCFSRGYSCIQKENCNDGIDNDCDELIDYNDTDCISCPVKIEGCWDKDVYYVNETATITVKIYDSKGNLIPNSPFDVYIYSYETGNREYDGRYETNSQGIYQISLKVPSHMKGKYEYEFFTATPNCESVTDFDEIEVIQPTQLQLKDYPNFLRPFVYIVVGEDAIEEEKDVAKNILHQLLDDGLQAEIILDTEITPTEKSKNLVLVGGPPTNRIIAEVLELPYPTFGSDAAEALGMPERTGLIKALPSPFSADSNIVIVSGWELDDLVRAVEILTNYSTYLKDVESNAFIVTPQTQEIEVACTDSDNGKNYYVKGITENATDYFIDFCLYQGGAQMVLFEGYCDNGKVMETSFTCPYGCSEGKCNGEEGITYTCTDTDDGKNYYEKGKVVAGNFYREDFCSSYEENELFEWYCGENNKFEFEVYECPYGCKDGACLKEAKTVELNKIFRIKVGETFVVPGKNITFTLIDYDVQEGWNGWEGKFCGKSRYASTRDYVHDDLECNGLYLEFAGTENDYHYFIVHDNVSDIFTLSNKSVTLFIGQKAIVTDLNISLILVENYGNGSVRIRIEESDGSIKETTLSFYTNKIVSGDNYEIELYTRYSQREKITFLIKKKEKYYRIDLYDGWNLFSWPVIYEEIVRAGATEFHCDGEVASPIWHYENGGYIKVNKPSPGEGYWTMFRIPEGGKCYYIIRSGKTFDIDAFNELNAGWNLIGAPSEPVKFSDVVGNCKVISGPWKYNPQTKKYELSDYLRPGEGYWVKVAKSCTLGSALPPLPPS